MRSKNLFSPLLFSFLVASAVLAQAPIPLSPDVGGAGSEESLVDLSVAFDVVPAAASLVRGVVTVNVKNGWHVNSARPRDEFAIPTTLRIESPALTISRVDYPAHVERSFTFTGGEKLAVYEGTFAIPFYARPVAAEGDVRAILHYQACNDMLCLPPREAVILARYPSGSLITSAPPPDPAMQVAAFTPLSAAPSPAGTPGLFSSDIGRTLASRGLLLTLVAVFVLGLALNLTPCVYPLIPITVAFFSSQTGGRLAQRVGLSTTYVLGIAATYSALGVFSALTGRLFGVWLQQPFVLIFFALLMLFLAASMFGAYDIQAPRFIVQRASSRSGYLGALSMGLAAGVVAAPCVGPFVISLIALVGQRGDALLGFFLFFVLALGLGLPFLILGIFSSAVSSIPRSGAWMVQIKKVLGFVLIAMAFYFLRPVIGDEIYRWGVGLSLAIGAIFLLVRPEPNRAGNIIRIAAAVLLAVAGTVYLLPRNDGPGLSWSRYEEAALQTARLTRKPVMIDFYADWCLPCKELDEKTFTDPQVMTEGDRFIRLKADLTQTADSLSRELTARYKIIGVPTIVFIDSDGREANDVRLAGFENGERFLNRMRRVR